MRPLPRIPCAAKHGRRLARCAAAVAVLTLAACSGRPAEPPHGPLVVIGADGLEWTLVQEMRATGRLPAIDAMAREGTVARLSTLAPAYSPRIWTSIATGLEPEEHGILGFVQANQRDAAGQPLLFTSRQRRAKALWDIAGDAGLSSCVVGWWITAPVEEIHGVMVAQTSAPPGSEGADSRKGGLVAGRSGQVWPGALEERVFARAREAAAELPAREAAILGDASSWPPALRDLAGHSRWSLAADLAYERIALDLLAERSRCDVLLVYVGLPDVLGHRFWRWTRPGDFAFPPPAEEVEQYGQVLRRAYEHLDAFVGALRREAGPSATTVLLSDHGMGAFRPSAPADATGRDGVPPRSGAHSGKRDAFVAAAGPGIAASTPRDHVAPASPLPRIGSVLDVAPTLLALRDLPRGADMPGRPLASLLDPVFAAAHPQGLVPTHTPAGWQASRRFVELRDDDGPARLDQLRGLGYLH